MGDAEGFGLSSWELPVTELGGLWEEQAVGGLEEDQEFHVKCDMSTSRDLKCVTIVYVCTIVLSFQFYRLGGWLSQRCVLRKCLHHGCVILRASLKAEYSMPIFSIDAKPSLHS